MARRVSLAVVLGLLSLPAIVRAQYGGDAYAPAQPVMPAVPAFNPMMTPEWRQAGGNYQAWEQLMMQKMAAQQQADFQQQAQAYQAWAKANPKEAAALEKAYKAQMNPNVAAGARRKKATAKSLTAAKGAKPAAAKGAKPAAKPKDDADEEEVEPKPTASPKAAAAKPAAPAIPAATSTLRSSRQGTAKPAAPK